MDRSLHPQVGQAAGGHDDQEVVDQTDTHYLMPRQRSRGAAAEARSVVVRRATRSDEPLLRRMLLVAAFPPGSATPSPESIPEDPRLARYIIDWGRAGDAAVIGEVNGRAVGAAWYRRFNDDAPGHGFVAESVPELSLAVAENWRGRGVGRQLLTALLDTAQTERLPAISLSVSARNTSALRLYRSLGFVRIAGDEAHPTMLRWLRGEPSAPPVTELETGGGRVTGRIVEIFSTGDLGAIPSVIDQRYIDHQGLGRGPVYGQEGFSMVVAAARSATPDLRVTIADLVSEPGRVVARLRWARSGNARRRPARETLDVLRIAEGRLVEHWGARVTDQPSSGLGGRNRATGAHPSE